MTTIKIIDEHFPSDDTPEHLKTYSKSIKYDYLVKFLIVGDKGVGKTSLILKYVENTFLEEPPSTIVDNHVHKLSLINDAVIKGQFWDVPYTSQSLTNRRSAIMGMILAFDLTNESSFNNLTTYINDLVKRRENGGSEPVVILVGTKCDKRSERNVSQASIDEFIEKNQISAYVETSSKTGNNVHALFKTISMLVYNQFIRSETPESEKDKPALQYDANRNRYYFHSSNNNQTGNEGNEDNTPGSCIIL